jgi:predicted anti-sigma-YlaC factor YlaD
MDAEALLSLLTMYVDGQLKGQDLAKIESLLASSDKARELEERLREATGFVGGLVAEGIDKNDTPMVREGGGCLDEVILLKLTEGNLTSAEIKKIEEHILKCDSCLRKVISNIRTGCTMEKGDFPEVPPKVMAEVMGEPIVNEAEPEEDKDKIVNATVDLETGMVVPSEIVFESVRVMLSCVENKRMGKDIALQLYDSVTSINCREITVVDNSVGRKYFSFKTDSRGKGNIPRIAKGSYTLHFDGTHLKINLRVG